MNLIITKYKDISQSIEKFLKNDVANFDNFLKNTRCTSELTRLLLVIQKEILLNKKTLGDNKILEDKDRYITDNILSNVDFTKAINLLFDYIENRISKSELVDKSILLDLEYAIKNNKSDNKLFEFVDLVNKIKEEASVGSEDYSFAKMFMEDVVNSFDNNSNQNFITQVNEKYLSFDIDLSLEHLDCLIDVRKFSSEYNKDKINFSEIFKEVNNKKVVEEIINLHRSKKEFGIYSEISFTINNKPYSYKFDLNSKTWNRDKVLIDKVLKKMEQMILEDIVQNGRIDELRDFVVVNEKREVLGQKYITDEDYKELKSSTQNEDIINILDNPKIVMEKEQTNKRKIRNT